MAANGQQNGWAAAEDTLARLATTGLATAQSAVRHAIHWCQQYAQQTLPPGSTRMAYIYRPGSADRITLCLLAFVLLPWFRVPFFPSILLLLTFGHVGTIWLGQVLNLSKVKAYESLGTPMAAQQRLLQSKQEALLQAAASTAALQASVAALEAQAVQASELQVKHDQLVAQVSKMDSLQLGIDAAQKRLTRLPHLHAQLRALQARRRTLGRIKWAVRVLKAETAKADVYTVKYEQLKQARSQMQATKQALMQLQDEAHQVQLLEVQRGTQVHAAPPGRQLLSQSRSLKEGSAEHLGSSATSSPAKLKAKLVPPPVRSQSPRLNKVASNAGRLATCRSTDSSLSSSSRRLPAHTGISYGTCRDDSQADAGPDASDARPALDQSLEGAGSKLARRQVLAGAQPKLSSSKGHAGRMQPSDKPVSSGTQPIGGGGQLPESDTMSVGSTATSRGPASSVRHSVLLETPAGGSHLFCYVVDNEAYYTPMLQPGAEPDQLDLGSFTPGPEAAALAAALNAGSLAVPRRTLSLSAAASGAASGGGGTGAAGGVPAELVDDACFPAFTYKPSVVAGAGAGAGTGQLPAAGLKPAGSTLSSSQSLSLM